LKIFISYSKIDAQCFADNIYDKLGKVMFDILFDGDRSNHRNTEIIIHNPVKENFPKCDLVVVIVTTSYLKNHNIEKEILQCLQENKQVIVCLHRSIKYIIKPLRMDKIQSILFYNEYDLVSILYQSIKFSFLLWDSERKVDSPKFQNMAASKYAAEAIKLDSEGLHQKAILYYQRASEALIRLVEIYPDYKLNRVYLERASAYQNRIKALIMAINSDIL
jgi:hypothetical protein